MERYYSVQTILDGALVKDEVVSQDRFVDMLTFILLNNQEHQGDRNECYNVDQVWEDGDSGR